MEVLAAPLGSVLASVPVEYGEESLALEAGKVVDERMRAAAECQGVSAWRVWELEVVLFWLTPPLYACTSCSCPH